MSRIKHLIRKVVPGIGSKRGSLESIAGHEATVEVTGNQNTISSAKTDGEVHPLPQGGTDHHGRRRDRSLSLTEEKALRCEARETAEEREKLRHDAEKKKAYDEVRPLFRVLWPSTKPDYTQDPLKDNYGDRPFTNQKSGATNF